MVDLYVNSLTIELINQMEKVVKEWEKRIKASIEKGNTYTVVSNGQRWLCKFINGDYIVCNGLGTKLTDIGKVVKI